MSGTIDEENPFVNWLLEQLRIRGWNREDFAKAAKMDSSGINNVINRRKNLGVKVARRMAAALEIEQAELFKIAGLQDDESGGEIDPITKMIIAGTKSLPLDEKELVLDFVNVVKARSDKKKRVKATKGGVL